MQPQAGDIVLLPHKSIDVFETDLPDYLERMGITHLVIAGMTANLCCESTGRHAMEKGFDVTFLSDAIGADSIVAYEASIRVNYPLIANAVMTVEEFLAAIGSSSKTDIQVQAGDTIRGSDDGEIGTVEKVVEATEETEGYLLVPRGLIFQTDTYIPLNAVVKRSATNVFINIPKLFVGKMPWSKPPQWIDAQEKFGLPEDKVDKLYGSRSPSSQE